MISLFSIVVHVTVLSGADTALTKACVPLELVFAKYILLPQKTSANSKAPLIGISTISFCLTVLIKAAALLFYNSYIDSENHVFLDTTVHDSVDIDISTVSIFSVIHDANPSVPSRCFEQRMHVRIFVMLLLSIYLKTRR